MQNPTASLHLKPLLFTRPQRILLAALSGGLLSTGFLNHDIYFVTWVAFIPFLFALKNTSLRASYLLGLSTGVITFASGEYWLVNFMMQSKGYGFTASVVWASIYWLYSAHLFAFIAMLFTVLTHRTKLHEFILFPLITVSLFSAFPMIFEIRLGQTQIQFTSALQAIEFTGTHGLDAIIALVNIALYRSLYSFFGKNSKDIQKHYVPFSIVTVTVGMWFWYGVSIKPMARGELQSVL